MYKKESKTKVKYCFHGLCQPFGVLPG